jgi:hypothetical protein
MLIDVGLDVEMAFFIWLVVVFLLISVAFVIKFEMDSRPRFVCLTT